MLDYGLRTQELVELRAAHRRALNVREAYRINAVILLGKGRWGVCYARSGMAAVLRRDLPAKVKLSVGRHPALPLVLSAAI